MAGDPFPKIRVAAAQIAPVYLDREASTEKACRAIAEAAGRGAQLVSFGEAWMPGYPWWIFMDTPLAGGHFDQELYANAIEIPSDTTDALCDAARRNGIHVVMGLTERAGGSLYLAQIFIDDQGRIVGHRRKLKPSHSERRIWGEGDGADLFVVQTALGKVGGLNCWEHLQPLTKFAMYSFGEQIHVAAWPAFSFLSEAVDFTFGCSCCEIISRTYALEGGCFVIFTPTFMDQATVDKLCGDNAAKRATMRVGGGGAAIIGPNGAIIAGPLPDGEEGILVGDIDFRMIAAMKMVNDPVGHYARADATQLLINPNPREAVIATAPLSVGGRIGSHRARAETKPAPATTSGRAPAKSAKVVEVAARRRGER